MSDREILISLKDIYDNLDDIYDNSDLNSKTLESLMIQVEKLYDEKYKNVSKDELIFKCSCPHCQEDLIMSDLISYTFVCDDCDENFYSIEVYIPEKDKDLKIPKTITINYEDSKSDIFNLGYVDSDVCYYTTDNEAIYIGTSEMLSSYKNIIFKNKGEELATNNIFIDPEWDLGVFRDICDKYKDKKTFIYMSYEMKNNIEKYLIENEMER